MFIIQGDFYTQLVMDSLLLHRLNIDASLNKKKLFYKECNEQKSEATIAIENYKLEYPDFRNFYDRTHYTLIYVNYYNYNDMYRACDVENIYTADITNCFIKSTCFIPDDNPEFLSVYVFGISPTYKYNNKWLVEHEHGNIDKSHGEVFFMKSDNVKLIL